MNQPKYLLCLKWAVLIIFTILALACNQSNKRSEIDTAVENDSILILIDQGKNSNIPIEKRALLLQKAHSSASSSKNDSLKPKYFSELSLAYLGLKDSLLFRTANSESIVYARIVNDRKTQAEAHWDLGTFFRNNVLLDSAYYNFREAHLLYSSIGDDFHSGRMLYNMAKSQVNVKDYTGAEINVFKAIELLKPSNDHRRLYNCYNLLGTISSELKEYNRALDYFENAENYLNNIENEKTRNSLYVMLQNNIGNVFKEQKMYLQAIPYYQNALKADSLLINEPSKYAMYLDNLASSRLNADDTLGVKDQLFEALRIRKEENEFAGIAKSYFSLAEYFMLQNDTLKALANAKLAEQFSIESSNNKRLFETLGILVLLDKENRIKHTLDYIQLQDKLIQEERQARDKFTRISFETAEVSEENQILTRKKQIWTGIALIVFTLGLAVYIIINQRVKNQALRFQQQQQASNQEIFDLMLSQKQKIEDTKKMEQKRISEELHDGVLGKMLGARMVLTGLNKRTNEEAVEERAIAISALKDVEGEVRAISHELSHAAYQNINNFITSIKDLLQSVGNANGIQHVLDYDDSFDWDSMKGDMKINLYRIIQETLQNAVKHSECKKILVNFVRTNDLLNVTISDDGKGFKAKTGKKGIGMRNIESRVGKLNGTWEIDSIVDMGTTITFNIPLKDYVKRPKIIVEEQVLKNIE
jgi:signal transduction histidine kinase